MHPRNRYRDNKPDFLDLARYRPSLMPFLIRKKSSGSSSSATTPYSHTVDFSNPEALRELACAFLLRDFGLEVELPPDRLVPMVPQRLNYIHWLEDLLMERRENQEEKREDKEEKEKRNVLGIDIGTGASCIYPLLGVATNDWHFLATETDSVSVQSATENVTRNNLQNKISVLEVSQDIVLVGAVSESQKYDFVMCNPPFYADQKERFEGVKRTVRRPAPPTFNTGTKGETVAEGGEIGFVKSIIEDSLTLRNQITWYTSMLGKKASLKHICQELRKHQISIVRSTQFVQGKTHRWAVAWSFDKTLCSSPSTSSCSSSTQIQYGEVTDLNKDEEVVERFQAYRLECTARKNTWSHQRKRRRLRQKLQQISRSGTGSDEMVLTDSETAAGVEDEQKEERESQSSVVEQCDMKVVGREFRASNTSVSVGLESIVSATEESASPSETQKTKEAANILQQIEALNSPCCVHFSCTLTCTPSLVKKEDNNTCLSPSPSKKVKLSEEDKDEEVEDEEKEVLLSFEWLSGDSKELINQIVQFLRNRT